MLKSKGKTIIMIMLQSESDSLETEKSTKQRFILIVILLITVTVAYFDRVNVSVLIADNEFQNAMGIQGQPVKIGMMMTGFLVAYGFGNIALSSVGDYFGPRKAVLVAIVIWMIAMIIGGLAPAFMIMIASRFILGIGEGLHFPMQTTFVKNWFPPKERARANVGWFVGTSLAPAIAMPFFAWIIFHMGWRFSFFVCCIFGLIPLVLIWRYVTDTPRQNKRINQMELQYIEDGIASEEPETIIENTKISVRENVKLVFSNYKFWLLVIYYSVHNFVYWALLTWLPTYLKTARGFSWEQMGFLASMPFVLSIVCKIIGGCASDYIGRRAPFCVIATSGAAACLFCCVQTMSNYIAAMFICIGMGVLTLGAPMAFTMLQQISPTKCISLSTGVMNGISFLFASLGPVVLGFFISLSSGYTGALYMLVGVALMGFMATLVLALKKL